MNAQQLLQELQARDVEELRALDGFSPGIMSSDLQSMISRTATRLNSIAPPPASTGLSLAGFSVTPLTLVLLAGVAYFVMK